MIRPASGRCFDIHHNDNLQGINRTGNNERAERRNDLARTSPTMDRKKGHELSFLKKCVEALVAQ